MQEKQISKKTADFLDNKALETQELFEKAILYRQKADAATTSFGKEYYAMKVSKTVKKLDANMGYFKFLESLKNAEDVLDEVKTDDVAAAEASE